MYGNFLQSRNYTVNNTPGFNSIKGKAPGDAQQSTLPSNVESRSATVNFNKSQVTLSNQQKLKESNFNEMKNSESNFKSQTFIPLLNQARNLSQYKPNKNRMPQGGLKFFSGVNKSQPQAMVFQRRAVTRNQGQRMHQLK